MIICICIIRRFCWGRGEGGGGMIKNVYFKFFNYEMHFFQQFRQSWWWQIGNFPSGKFSGVLQKLKCHLWIEGLDSTILGLRNSWKACLPFCTLLIKQSVTFNHVIAKPTKWSNTLKQFFGCSKKRYSLKLLLKCLEEKFWYLLCHRGANE